MVYKLICFDVDGTLVDNLMYSWQLFHDSFNTDNSKREEAKQRFYNNEISYEDWAHHDINLWKEKGIKKHDFMDALKISDVKLMPNALEVIKELKKQNLKLAIISGSLNIVLEYLLPDYKEIFDDVFISELIFNKNDELENANVTKFDMMHKATALKQVAERENIPLQQTVFVGDHKNDIDAMKIAGLSIAFCPNAKELNDVADKVIKTKDLKLILPLITDKSRQQ